MTEGSVPCEDELARTVWNSFLCLCLLEPVVVVHTCNPRYSEAVAGASQIAASWAGNVY